MLNEVNDKKSPTVGFFYDISRDRGDLWEVGMESPHPRGAECLTGVMKGFGDIYWECSKCHLLLFHQADFTPIKKITQGLSFHVTPGCTARINEKPQEGVGGSGIWAPLEKLSNKYSLQETDEVARESSTPRPRRGADMGSAQWVLWMAAKLYRDSGSHPRVCLGITWQQKEMMPGPPPRVLTSLA